MNEHEPGCRSHWWGWGRPPSTSWWTCSHPKVARPSFNSRKLHFTLKTPEFETSLNLFHIVNKYITQGWLVISKSNRWHHCFGWFLCFYTWVQESRVQGRRELEQSRKVRSEKPSNMRNKKTIILSAPPQSGPCSRFFPDMRLQGHIPPGTQARCFARYPTTAWATFSPPCRPCCLRLHRRPP